MESQIAKQLDYKKLNYTHPTYRLTKLLQQSGLQTFNLTNTGAPDTYIELPVKVMNLARSHLYFELTPTAGAAYLYAFADAIAPIRQIQLYTRGGTYLTDLNFSNVYTNLVQKPETKFEEYMTYPKYSTVSTERAYLGAVNLSNIGATTLGLNGRFDGSAYDVGFTEPLYMEPGGTGTATPVYKVGLQLNKFVNTIFAVDKDIYANEILILRIVWENSNRIYANGTAAANPSTGTTAYTGNIGVANLALFLAIEKNQLIANEIIQKVASTGLEIPIPYVYSFKNNFGAAATQTVSIRVNRGQGRLLKKIYHGIYNNTESANTAYDHDERANAKVQVYYTMLNNEREQEYNVTTATFDDYLLLKDKIVDSVIQSPDMYYYNWFWVSDYTNKENKDPHSLSDNLSSGLDLSVEQKWDFYGMTMVNAAYNHYTFAITEKMLTVSSSGLTCL